MLPLAPSMAAALLKVVEGCCDERPIKGIRIIMNLELARDSRLLSNPLITGESEAPGGDVTWPNPSDLNPRPLTLHPALFPFLFSHQMNNILFNFCMSLNT